MDVIIVVDMQVGLLKGDPKHDLPGVIDRINTLTAMVRGASGKVIWVRHRGKAGDDFEPHSAGWSLLPELNIAPVDIFVEKTLNDPFSGTSLQEILNEITPDRVLIAGWATDFCVDATVRSAVSNNHHVVVVSDGHTLSDRPHLNAPVVIEHHNWIWRSLITNRSIQVQTAAHIGGSRSLPLDHSERIVSPKPLVCRSRCRPYWGRLRQGRNTLRNLPLSQLNHRLIWTTFGGTKRRLCAAIFAIGSNGIDHQCCTVHFDAHYGRNFKMVISVEDDPERKLIAKLLLCILA